MGCGVSRVGGSSRGGFPRGQAGIRSPRLLLLAPSSPASNFSNPQPKATGLHRCRVSRARSHSSPAVTSAGRLPRGTGTMERCAPIPWHASSTWTQKDLGHATQLSHEHRRTPNTAHNHPTSTVHPYAIAHIYPMDAGGPGTWHTTTPQPHHVPISRHTTPWIQDDPGHGTQPPHKRPISNPTTHNHPTLAGGPRTQLRPTPQPGPQRDLPLSLHIAPTPPQNTLPKPHSSIPSPSTPVSASPGVQPPPDPDATSSGPPSPRARGHWGHRPTSEPPKTHPVLLGWACRRSPR